MTPKKGLNVKLIWGLMMVLVYLGMGFLLVFTNLFTNINFTLRIVFGVLFLIYGIIRAYSIWQNR